MASPLIAPTPGLYPSPWNPDHDPEAVDRLLLATWRADQLAAHLTARLDELANALDDAPETSELHELWRVTKPDRAIVCRVREIPTGDGYVALELRVEHNGQIYLTEVHKERVAFTRRVEELRRLLEAHGWLTSATSHRSV